MKRSSAARLCVLCLSCLSCLLCLVGAKCEDDGPTGGPDGAGAGSTGGAAGAGAAGTSSTAGAGSIAGSGGTTADGAADASVDAGNAASTDAGLDAGFSAGNDAMTVSDSGSGAAYDCVLEGAACLIAVPVCAQGEVPSVEGSCYGPCVPIEQCKCDGPQDCPDSAHYTCFNYAHHCGPYTQ